MKLRNVLLIARRDYLAYVARRRFWIGLLAVPAIILLIIFVPVLIHKFEHAHKYAVADQSAWVLEAVNQHIAAGDYDKLLTLAAANAKAGTTINLPKPLAAVAQPAAKLAAPQRQKLAQAIAAGKPAPTEPAALAVWGQRAALARWYKGLTPDDARSLDGQLAAAKYQFIGGNFTPAELRDKVNHGKLFAYFVIPRQPLEPGAKFVYASQNLTDTGLRNWFGDQLNEVIRSRKVASVGLSPAKAAWLKTPVELQGKLVTKAGARQATAAEQIAQRIPFGYVILLYIAVIGVAQMLMMSTIDEKSNRIAETLLSSVEPADVMAGKTLGVAGVGVTMVCSWLAIVLGLIAGFGSSLPLGGFAHALITGISAWGIAWFLVYFILGFLLYATVLGAIGAAVNNIQEAQPFLVPVIMFMYIPLVIAWPVVKDPNATWARVLSYFPPLTPFLMVNRAAAPPPLVDYIATTALLIAVVVLVLWASGKIFRVGLLNTGAPPKLRELLAWLRSGQKTPDRQQKTAS